MASLILQRRDQGRGILTVVNLPKVAELVACGTEADILGQPRVLAVSPLCIEQCVPVLGPENMVSVAYFSLGLACYLWFSLRVLWGPSLITLPLPWMCSGSTSGHGCNGRKATKRQALNQGRVRTHSLCLQVPFPVPLLPWGPLRALEEYPWGLKSPPPIPISPRHF